MNPRIFFLRESHKHRIYFAICISFTPTHTPTAPGIKANYNR
ncbi:hypothetical protein PUN28_011971 [Cardiocondyla obscurior]|uniref:Uncharacterized protein n=1 Tax=Cardiocondyla obscurior TaxID=286306 RepID=A0AAW2FDI3_9HYME